MGATIFYYAQVRKCKLHNQYRSGASLADMHSCIHQQVKLNLRNHTFFFFLQISQANEV